MIQEARKAMKILVINVGGASTKLAIYEDKSLLAEKTLNHPNAEMEKYATSAQQVMYRAEMVRRYLKENNLTMDDIEAIGIRGAVLKQASHGGTYRIDEKHRKYALRLYTPDKKPLHPVRIAIPIADELIGTRDIPMFDTDPGAATEIPDVGRVTGLKGEMRRPMGHVLNQKAVARKEAEKQGKAYKDCRFVVAHLGSGISVGAHANGGVIQMNNAGGGWGPFSPIRLGTVEANVMIDICFRDGMTANRAKYIARNESGLVSHLGTNDMREVERRILDGDAYAKLVYQAMAYQVGTEICARMADLRGKCDAIIITGAIANSRSFVKEISQYVDWAAPVVVYAGDYENEGLAMGAYRVITGEEAAQQLDDGIIDTSAD